MVDMKRFMEMCNQVYSTLGPGYSERVYHNALEVLFRTRGIPYETEKIVPIVFEGHTIGNLRIDLLAEQTVIECKAIKSMNLQMKFQAQNYLHLTGLSQALMVNFPQCDSPQGCEFLEITSSQEPSQVTFLQ